MQKRPTVAFSVSVTGTLRGTWLLNSPDNRCDFRNDFRCDFHCDTDRCGSRYIYQWDTHAFTPRFYYFLSSRSNRCALSISDRRFWEPKEASQFAQWELSERDVIHPAYTCQMERCQEKTLAYAQTGIEILLVGNFRLHYTRRRENRNASEHWI